MFSNIVVKSVSGCGVYCVPCSLSQTARHTVHTTTWNTFYQHYWTYNDVFLLIISTSSHARTQYSTESSPSQQQI